MSAAFPVALFHSVSRRAECHHEQEQCWCERLHHVRGFVSLQRVCQAHHPGRWVSMSFVKSAHTFEFKHLDCSASKNAKPLHPVVCKRKCGGINFLCSAQVLRNYCCMALGSFAFGGFSCCPCEFFRVSGGAIPSMLGKESLVVASVLSHSSFSQVIRLVHLELLH